MRLNYLDHLRGIAVILMIIFHFSYDLKIFHYVQWDFSQGFWYGFPRFIAFLFLFCVGISLHLAHTPNTHWYALGKRSLKLGTAALAVSLVTYVLFPQQWIFFGTLHCILVGSLLGGIIVNHRKVAWALLFMLLFFQYILNYDIKWVSSFFPLFSMDFIPIYPWFWVIILGILTAPSLSRISYLQQLKPLPGLSYLGQKSLPIYLIHQPLLYGLLWAYTELHR